jgi:uncharacterized protein (TIGR02147 family)
MLMKSILQYKDYRKYIRDFYAWEKNNSGFSWREFSRRAKFTSPNFLKLVSEGKSKLSAPSAERVADAMDLVGFEKIFFQNLVVYNQSKDSKKGKAALEKLQVIAKENAVRKMGAGYQNFYSTWLHAVVRELACSIEKPTAESIAKRCRLVVSPAEVADSIGYLLKAGLLKSNGRGGYRQTEKIVEGDEQGIPLTLRAMNRQMARLAEQALDEVPPEWRDITGITMGLSQQSYARVLGALASCRKKILDIVAKEESVDRVYRLNLQLFPMTTIKSDKENESNDNT